MQKRIVSRIAICLNCGWINEEYGNMCLVKSKQHAKKFKHKVSIETAYTIAYDYRI